MQTSQDMLTSMQTQALEAIRTGQAATLEAVKNWSETVAKMTPAAPAAQVPAEFKAAFGEPSEIIDSVYDFASQLLELNKKFVHDLLEASKAAQAK